MKKNFAHRDVIAASDFNKDEILHILHTAGSLKRQPQPDLLKRCILGSCFFEPSTRTRLSFESAMHRLGGSVVGFTDTHSTSVKKGESLSDMMAMIQHYADIIVIRHPLEGSALQAAEAIDKPVINAGDGANQHPTQTFLDLYTILESQGRLDGLSIAMAGDLKHGRTVHSLAQACRHFGARLYFISPPSLELPEEICDDLKDKGIKFSFHTKIEDAIEKSDVLYMTRIQEERFAHRLEYEQVKNAFKLNLEQIKKAKSSMKILHPLPRLDEIDRAVDRTPHAYYFQQAENGLYIRQALLALILGKIS